MILSWHSILIKVEDLHGNLFYLRTDNDCVSRVNRLPNHAAKSVGKSSQDIYIYIFIFRRSRSPFLILDNHSKKFETKISPVRKFKLFPDINNNILL